MKPDFFLHLRRWIAERRCREWQRELWVRQQRKAAKMTAPQADRIRRAMRLTRMLLRSFELELLVARRAHRESGEIVREHRYLVVLHILSELVPVQR